MSVLAHVFEAAGLATVTLSNVRAMAEKVKPPRALHGEFPLGRPLGIPGDPAFQHEVLAQAFALLDEPRGPVLRDFPLTIEATDEPLACSLPPRFDPDLPPAVDEARGLRKAYDRAVARRGATSVGRAIGPDEVPAALAALHAIAHGADLKASGLPGGGNTTAVCHDVRTYYEEAALELADGPPAGARAVESWYFERTEAGRTVLAARAALRDGGAKFPVWFYMTPGHR